MQRAGEPRQEAPGAQSGAGRLVFLTGATGFIGARLARLLAGRGWRLRCLVRTPAKAAGLVELGAEIVEGDLSDRDAMRRAMRGAELAYHLAGVYDLGPLDQERLERVNVQGTLHFIEALGESGVPRAVYVSTTLALGPVEEGEGAATDHVPPRRYRSVYERTKTEAHRLALDAQRQGLPLIIACPAYVYGPGDEGPAGRFLSDLFHGRIPGLPTRTAWFSFVHVDDVARGLLLAGERGRPGATYILGGEPARIEDFAKRAAELRGTRVPRLRFPPALVRATGIALDALSRVTGRRLPISRENAETTAGDMRWLHAYRETADELGWKPRSLAEGLPETVASVE